MTSNQQRFTDIVAAFSGMAGVTPPTGGNKFGSSSLKVDGSIFAMLDSAGDFVVKLPKQQVDGLVAAGKGIRFDPRRTGKPMAEWLVLSPACADEWLALAREALHFVGRR